MYSRPRLPGKIDVLDMLVTILEDHEKNLSNIVDKLDILIENLSSVMQKISKEIAPKNGCCFAVIDCRKWSEFKEASMSASLIAYEIDKCNVFSISSARHSFIFRYTEKLQASRNDMVIHSGDSVYNKVSNLDPLSLRLWLSEELRIPEEKVIEGNLFKSLCQVC